MRVTRELLAWEMGPPPPLPDSQTYTHGEQQSVRLHSGSYNNIMARWELRSPWSPTRSFDCNKNSGPPPGPLVNFCAFQWLPSSSSW